MDTLDNAASIFIDNLIITSHTLFLPVIYIYFLFSAIKQRDT